MSLVHAFLALFDLGAAIAGAVAPYSRTLGFVQLALGAQALGILVCWRMGK